ncbi:hypothetical protein QYM36_006232, partial [Artemia franciscana]
MSSNLLRISCSSLLKAPIRILSSAGLSSRKNLTANENQFGFKVIEKINHSIRTSFNSDNKISDQKLKQVYQLKERVQLLNYSEYMTILTAMVSQKEKSKNLGRDHHEMLKHVSQYAVNSYRSWTMDQVLTASTIIFYNLDDNYRAKFAIRVMPYLQEQIISMSTQQFVQFMFLINLIRKFNCTNVTILESKVESCLTECTLDQICVVFMGMFKSQTSLTSITTLNKIIEFVERSSRILNDIQLSIVLKFLSYHKKMYGAIQSMHIQNIFLERLPLLNTYNCSHILSIGQYQRSYNREIVNYCVKKLLHEIKLVRLKEIEKLLQCLCFLNQSIFEDINVCQLLLDELKSEQRKEELIMHPKSLVNLLFNLSLLNPLPDDFLELVLSEEFIKALPRERYPLVDFYLYNIAISSAIEKPGYKGPMPSMKFLKEVRNKWIFKDHKSNQSMGLSILSRIEEAVEKSQILHVLPSYAMPDVVFCETEDGVRIPLPEEYKKSDEIIRKPTDNQLKWNVVVLGMKNKYQSDSQQPIAAFSQRLNLLRKLGYHVIE